MESRILAATHSRRSRTIAIGFRSDQAKCQKQMKTCAAKHGSALRGPLWRSKRKKNSAAGKFLGDPTTGVRSLIERPPDMMVALSVASICQQNSREGHHERPCTDRPCL